MLSIMGKYLLSLILIISFLTIASAGTKTTTKIISLKYKTPLLENFYKSGSSSFVFGACDPRARSWQRSCTFAIQTKKPTESLDHVKICDFKIKANANSGYIGEITEVHDFGDDKAILKYMGKYGYIRFIILNFTNCEAKVSKIDDNLHILTGDILTIDDEMFHVVDRKFGNCTANGNGRFAFKKMILDSRGNIVTDLLEWMCNDRHNIIGAIRSPLKGHIIIDAKSILNKQVRILEVDQDDVTILKEYENSDVFASTVAISNTYSKLSICYQAEVLRFDCSQYDYNGGLQFEMSFEFKHPSRFVNIYNLPNGGFLVLAQESIRDDEIAILKTQQNHLVISKVNEHGKLVNIIKLPEEFDHNVDFQKIHFNINENNEYCFSYVFDSPLMQDDKLVNLSVTCLNDSSLIN